MSTIDFLRQFRFEGFAIFDFVVSYLGFYLLSPLIIKLFSYFNISISKSNIMWLVLPMSILFHIIFKADTPLTKMFLDPSGYYIAKITIILMLFMGLRDFIFK